METTQTTQLDLNALTTLFAASADFDGYTLLDSYLGDQAASQWHGLTLAECTNQVLTDMRREIVRADSDRWVFLSADECQAALDELHADGDIAHQSPEQFTAQRLAQLIYDNANESE